jgi:hypothetical protein
MTAPNKYFAGRAHAQRGGSSLSDQAPTQIVEKPEALRLFEEVTEFTSVEGHAVKLATWCTEFGDSTYANIYSGVPSDFLIPSLRVWVNDEMVHGCDVIDHTLQGACIASYGIPVARIPHDNLLEVIREIKEHKVAHDNAWEEIRDSATFYREGRELDAKRAELRALELTALKLEDAHHEFWRCFRVGLLWFLAICLGIAANFNR